MRGLGRRDWPESIPGRVKLVASYPLAETLAKEPSLSGPVLAHAVQARAAKVLRSHRNPEFNFGIQAQEPGLGKPWDIGRAIDIHNQNSTAFAVSLAEPGVFRLDSLEDLFHLRPDGSVFRETVERFNGKLNQHDHPHL